MEKRVLLGVAQNEAKRTARGVRWLLQELQCQSLARADENNFDKRRKPTQIIATSCPLQARWVQRSGSWGQCTSM